MPRTHPQKAIDDCFELYLRFNGKQHDLIAKGMQKLGYTWSKANLVSRGKGPNRKMGWPEKFGWDEQLKFKRQILRGKGAAPAEKLLLEVQTMREAVYERLVAVQGGVVNKDLKELEARHIRYCELTTTVMARLDTSVNNFESFVAAWELLMELLPQISTKTLTGLLEHDERILQLVKERYANEER